MLRVLIILTFISTEHNRVAGWRQKEKPLLYNAFHIGDQIVCVEHCSVSSAAEVNRLIKNDGGSQVHDPLCRMNYHIFLRFIQIVRITLTLLLFVHLYIYITNEKGGIHCSADAFRSCFSFASRFSRTERWYCD